jgi:hypothetical protein
MDFITGDGGFDFSMNFNEQENNISQLLFAQIAFAVCMQKKGGCFVLKIFDSFLLHTLDLLALLSSFYKKVYIVKPFTSRYANSEKYVVCKSFLFDSCDDIYPFFLSAFERMAIGREQWVSRYLAVPLSYYFINKIEEYNSIFGQQQIENIYFTISLIETKNKIEKIDLLTKTNIQKSVNWCIKHEIPYHIFPNNTNIFMHTSSESVL